MSERRLGRPGRRPARALDGQGRPVRAASVWELRVCGIASNKTRFKRKGSGQLKNSFVQFAIVRCGAGGAVDAASVGA